MKKILVPTDFSEHANYATRNAIHIARKQNAEIILLHIIDMPKEAMDAIMPGSDIPTIIRFKQLAEQQLFNIASSSEFSGIKVSQSLVLGRTFDKVNEVAQEIGADLIVMGSHGASGFKELFLGSNTEKVVRTSKIPVAVIKGISNEIDFKTFLLASDFRAENKESYKKIINFCDVYGVKPHFLLVNTPNNFSPTPQSETRIKEFLSEIGVSDYQYSIYNDFEIESGILNFADRIKPDLIIVGTHGRKGFSRLLNGSITEDLVNHSPYSVLTFKI